MQLLDKQLDHAIEIGIADAKAPRNKVTTPLGNHLPVCDYVELPLIAGRKDGVNTQAALDEGHETRDLGTVVLSSRAVNDFYFHSALRTNSCSYPPSEKERYTAYSLTGRPKQRT